ncbi:hypothetical protein HZS_127 [Henneguya salminicola]|nr:hypothetical protein HZS_127 [Henneguya salminicola]
MPMRSQLSDFNIQPLLAGVGDDEILITRMLAEDCNVDHSTILCRLKKLGKDLKRGCVVPC